MNKSSNKLPIKFILYSTKGCHLCQEARANLQHSLSKMTANSQPDFIIDEIDVFSNEQYRNIREQIPIIETENRERLVFPFGAKDIDKIVISLYT